MIANDDHLAALEAKRDALKAELTGTKARSNPAGYANGLKALEALDRRIDLLRRLVATK